MLKTIAGYKESDEGRKHEAAVVARHEGGIEFMAARMAEPRAPAPSTPKL